MDFLTESYRPIYAQVLPWQAVLVILLVGFGGAMLVRLNVEKRRYLLRWKAFTFGMSIGLPFYSYFASRGLQDYESSGGWYDKPLFHGILMLMGLGVGLYLLKDAQKNRFVTKEEARIASERFILYISYPSFFFFIGHSAIDFFFVADNVSGQDKFWALMGLLFYAAWLLYDMFLNPERKDRGR